MEDSHLSVIVPVRNEAANIRHTLNCLLRQEFETDRFEIIVVDGQSDDETVAVVRELQSSCNRLRLLFNPARYSSGARNVGIRHARGDIVVIVDGHCEIDSPRYLQEIVNAFKESSADCLGRPQPLDVNGASTFQRGVALARQSWLGHNPDSAIFSDRSGFVEPQNVAIAYRRDVFARVGLFDERFDACEDVEFNSRVARAGLKCYFTPTIQVRYQPRSSLRGLWYQMNRYGKGRARLGQKDPSSMTFASLVPALWLVWLVATLLLGLVWMPALLVCAGSLLTYFVIVLGEALRLSNGREAGRLALIFAVIHTGFGWGFLKESLGTVRVSAHSSRQRKK